MALSRKTKAKRAADDKMNGIYSAIIASVDLSAAANGRIATDYAFDPQQGKFVLTYNERLHENAGVPTRGAVDVTRSLMNTAIGGNPGAIKRSAQAQSKILRQTARATRP